MARTVKTSKPGTRIQYRGQCCLCGKMHAVSNGRNVAHHGFTLKWGYTANACAGSHAPYYGHPDAPKYLSGVIEGLKDRLAKLPQMIECQQQVVSQQPVRTPERRKAQQRLDALNRELKTYPDAIESLTKRMENWEAKPLVEVDVELEEKEARAKATQDREAKRAAKAQEAEAKELRKQEREARAAQKLAERLAHNHHRVIFNDKVVKAWEASYATEDDYIKAMREALTECGKEAGLDEYDQFNATMSGRMHYETRTAADGKGRRLYTSK